MSLQPAQKLGAGRLRRDRSEPTKPTLSWRFFHSYGKMPFGVRRKKSLPGSGPGRPGTICGVYPPLPRRAPVRTTLVPVTFWLPWDVVNSPVSFASPSLPLKLISND